MNALCSPRSTKPLGASRRKTRCEESLDRRRHLVVRLDPFPSSERAKAPRGRGASTTSSTAQGTVAPQPRYQDGTTCTCMVTPGHCREKSPCARGSSASAPALFLAPRPMKPTGAGDVTVMRRSTLRSPVRRCEDPRGTPIAGSSPGARRIRRTATARESSSCSASAGSNPVSPRPISPSASRMRCMRRTLGNLCRLGRPGSTRSASSDIRKKPRSTLLSSVPPFSRSASPKLCPRTQRSRVR